jgi:small nuclear ribonucleoprotein (snRNP)-like protein
MSRASHILPQEMLDKCIGTKVWIITKTDREIGGILRGFDDYWRIFIFNNLNKTRSCN